MFFCKKKFYKASKLLVVFALIHLFLSENALAIPSIKTNDNNLPTVLKAKMVEGDNEKKLLIASGDVEITKGNTKLYADQITYDKNNKLINAIGNLKVNNLEIGNVYGSRAEFKDDFSKGSFFDSKIFFNDGSYIHSKRIDRETANITSLYNTVFSFCPNEELVNDYKSAGKKIDFASILSHKTKIDRDKQTLKTSHGIFRIMNVPLIYFPYLSTPLPAKKRESGLLPISYVKNSNFGFGIKLPYYYPISDSMDFTFTPLLYSNNNQFLIENAFRNYSKYGKYILNFEIANNRVVNNVDTVIVNRTNQQYRWQVQGKGDFNINHNLGSDFDLNTISDRDYQRDYHFNYSAFTLSKINFDYIKGRNYYAVKTIRFQELESKNLEKSAPFILPQIQANVESKPYFFKERFILNSDFVALQRDDGLQYRRLTLSPQAKIPFNFKGNLFDISARLQNDLYSLENNYKLSNVNNNQYKSIVNNYKTEYVFNWRLPVVRKSKNNTIMLEPMFTLVSSAYKKNFNTLPNEESNNSELSYSNLFIADRLSGNDRNEIGERFSYGLKSAFFNKYGEFGLFAGQSHRISDGKQDVEIRGFADNNKSNIVGKAFYKAKKYFNFSYLFQLNESSYNNEVNQLTSGISFEKFSLLSDYLLIKKTIQNPQKKEQLSLNVGINLDKKWQIKIFANHDLALKRTLQRGMTFTRNGCCTIFSFSISENNPSNLTKPQKTFNLNLSFKNL
ncbi:LPS-assembly protein LptD [Alphaproteobacteria bacterium]|nr:LPS-assembly protein LptD [Alphaproteobacteria bacterium]